jgi:hypothetical protein
MARPTPEELNEARKRKQAEDKLAAAEHDRRREEKEREQAKRIDEGLARLRELEARTPKVLQLTSVLDGYYREMDKLSKKDPVGEVTERILGRVNKLISESKAALEGDPFIDDVAVFVAAGERPPNCDVLFVLAEIRQGIGRVTKERNALALKAKGEDWEELSGEEADGDC